MESKVFASGVSKDKDWRRALKELASGVSAQFGSKRCDLVVFFVSESYTGFSASEFAGALCRLLPCRAAIGCNSSGVIGTDHEVEMQPAVSVLAMHLPGVKAVPFYMTAGEVRSMEDGTDLVGFLNLYPTDKPHFISLVDPASCDIQHLLDLFNQAYKGLPVIGGLASGGVVGQPNWLSLNGDVFTDGAVGVALVGNVKFEVVVSQGCRPIGKPYVITRAEENVLYELAGRASLEVVREVIEGLSARDKRLAESSLFVGLAMSEQKEKFKRGDFLVRNLLGFDPDAGTLVIGAYLKVGQTLQFQLRDSQTSEEDLKELLSKLPKQDSHPRGGLLVSCCGRGQGLFGEADHDVRLIQSLRGPMPLAGFFANGEIGPIGIKNYVHGYTSSLAVIR